MKEGSKTSIILGLNGDGRGHGMSMDTGPTLPVLQFPPNSDKGLPRVPRGQGVLQASLFHTHPSTASPLEEDGGPHTYCPLEGPSHSWAASLGVLPEAVEDCQPQNPGLPPEENRQC